MVQSKRTTRAEPEDHLWSADHSLRNAGLEYCATAIETVLIMFEIFLHYVAILCCKPLQSRGFL